MTVNEAAKFYTDWLNQNTSAKTFSDTTDLSNTMNLEETAIPNNSDTVILGGSGTTITGSLEDIYSDRSSGGYVQDSITNLRNWFPSTQTTPPNHVIRDSHTPLDQYGQIVQRNPYPTYPIQFFPEDYSTNIYNTPVKKDKLDSKLGKEIIAKFENNPNYFMKYIEEIDCANLLNNNILLKISFNNVDLSNKEIIRFDNIHSQIKDFNVNEKTEKLSEIFTRNNGFKKGKTHLMSFFNYLLNEDLSFVNSKKGTSEKKFSDIEHLIETKTVYGTLCKFNILLYLNKEDFLIPSRFMINDLFGNNEKQIEAKPTPSQIEI